MRKAVSGCEHGVAKGVAAVNRRRFVRFLRDFGGGGAGHFLLPAPRKVVVPRSVSFVLSNGVR